MSPASELALVRGCVSIGVLSGGFDYVEHGIFAALATASPSNGGHVVGAHFAFLDDAGDCGFKARGALRFITSTTSRSSSVVRGAVEVVLLPDRSVADNTWSFSASRAISCLIFRTCNNVFDSRNSIFFTNQSPPLVCGCGSAEDAWPDLSASTNPKT